MNLYRPSPELYICIRDLLRLLTRRPPIILFQATPGAVFPKWDYKMTNNKYLENRRPLAEGSHTIKEKLCENGRMEIEEYCFQIIAQGQTKLLLGNYNPKSLKMQIVSSYCRLRCLLYKIRSATEIPEYLLFATRSRENGVILMNH